MPPPDDPASAVRLLSIEDQVKHVRDAGWTFESKAGPFIREVADDALDGRLVPLKGNPRTFERAPSEHVALLFHSRKDTPENID